MSLFLKYYYYFSTSILSFHILGKLIFDNLHIFLGAICADAAARPLHWVYDPKKLKGYIKGKKEIAFLIPIEKFETTKVCSAGLPKKLEIILVGLRSTTRTY